MSIVQTVVMATNNRKDFSSYLLPFLGLALAKHLETRQSCENDLGQYFENNLKK